MTGLGGDRVGIIFEVCEDSVGACRNGVGTRSGVRGDGVGRVFKYVRMERWWFCCIQGCGGDTVRACSGMVDRALACEGMWWG